MKHIEWVLIVGAALAASGCSRNPFECHRYFYYPSNDEFYYDPIEDDPKYVRAFREAGDAASRACGPPRLGFGPCVQEEKKRILKERYSIDWRTPMELNPCVIFD